MSWRKETYAQHLFFAKECIEQFEVEFRISVFPFEDITGDDFIFYKKILPDADSYKFFKEFYYKMEHAKIYRIHDGFRRKYISFLLPGEDVRALAFIGPYMDTQPTLEELHSIAEYYHISPGLFPEIQSYYEGVTIISDDIGILAVINTLGTRIWGSADSFSYVDTSEVFSVSGNDSATGMNPGDAMEPTIRIKMLENRYKLEQELMKAVSHGQTHQAELLHNRFTASQRAENRTPNPLRNSQNYMIILNTIMRKAAEQGYVHSLHIDRVSSQVARKIEQLDYNTNISLFSREIVRKYCILVRNYSLAHYSEHVRDTITLITADLASDLNLKTIAKTLNVNPSYLSSLFKKEVGVTLTEYVTSKRIEHAVFLLNSTSMQISTIALYCGITDVQYFSKIFKKQIGKSPSEYRKMITDSSEQ